MFFLLKLISNINYGNGKHFGKNLDFLKQLTLKVSVGVVKTRPGGRTVVTKPPISREPTRVIIERARLDVLVVAFQNSRYLKSVLDF